jgi:hypothetical protein
MNNQPTVVGHVGLQESLKQLPQAGNKVNHIRGRCKKYSARKDEEQHQDSMSLPGLGEL